MSAITCNECTRADLMRATAGRGLPSIEPGMPLPAGTGLTRRKFVAKSVGLALSVYGAGRLQLFDEGIASAATVRHSPILVSVFLQGGADSLSLLYPEGDPLYQKLRTDLAVTGGTQFTEDPRLYWNPALSPLSQLHDEGKVTVLPAIGYDHPDQSHFTSRHYWEVGATDPRLLTGWLGRYLDIAGQPNNPIQGLSLDTTLSPTLATSSVAVAAASSPTSYRFDWGSTTSYGTSTPVTAAGSGASALAVTASISGLASSSTYHYRLVATNGSGTTNGADSVFTTQAAPGVTPDPPIAPAPGPGPDGPTLPPVSRPVFGQTATIAAISGSVLVELQGTSTFIPLSAASTVPVGTTIDATAGTVRLTNLRDRGGKLQSATFWGGAFTVAQSSRKHAPTVLALTAPVAGCSAALRHVAGAGATPKSERHLWGRDNHGRFVTRGRSAVATVRGTAWFMRESCAGTFVRVSRGSVSVRDLVRQRTILVSSGHSYLARRG